MKLFDTEDKFIFVCLHIGVSAPLWIEGILDDVFGKCNTNEVCFHSIIGEVFSGVTGIAIDPIIGAFIGVVLYETLYITIPSLLSSIKKRLRKQCKKMFTPKVDKMAD